jgi:hypothetical protein
VASHALPRLSALARCLIGCLRLKVVANGQHRHGLTLVFGAIRHHLDFAVVVAFFMHLTVNDFRKDFRVS